MDHLVGLAEVADLLGVSRARAHQLSAEPGFPEPEAELTAGTIWRRDAVEEWMRQHRALGSGITVPPRDRARPMDDPWDTDAVRYLLAQPGAESWSPGILLEHLRRQPRLVAANPGRVEKAAQLAAVHGVEVRPHHPGATLHFYRTDPDAPEYPDSDAERWLLRDAQRRGGRRSR